MAFNSFSAQLESYVQDRQAVLSALNTAIKTGKSNPIKAVSPAPVELVTSENIRMPAEHTGERRASLINGKIHNFKLERDVMVQQAASHIQVILQLFCSNRV
jgi:hypothetical protein